MTADSTHPFTSQSPLLSQREIDDCRRRLTRSYWRDWPLATRELAAILGHLGISMAAGVALAPACLWLLFALSTWEFDFASVYVSLATYAQAHPNINIANLTISLNSLGLIFTTITTAILFFAREHPSPIAAAVESALIEWCRHTEYQRITNQPKA